MAFINNNSLLVCYKTEMDVSSTCDSGFDMEREQLMAEDEEKISKKPKEKTSMCEDLEEKCDSGFLDSFSTKCSTNSETPVKLNSNSRYYLWTTELWNFRNSDQDTYLNVCIIHNAESLALLIINHSNPDFLNLRNNLFETPLHLAVYLQQKNIVRALVLKGSDTDAQDRNGNTACHLACHYGYLDCLQALTFPPTEEEKNLFNIDSSITLHSPKMDIYDWQGVTCFHMAAVQKHFDVMDYLLTLDTNINIQENTSGRTALHMAVELGDSQLVSYLIDNGADVDAVMYNGCSPLHLAVGRINANIAFILCQAGADYLLPNDEDETAQDLANVNKIHSIDAFDDLKLWGQPLA